MRPAAGLMADPRRQPTAWGADNQAQWSAVDRAALDREDAFDATLPGMPMRIGVNRPTAGGPIGLGRGRRTRDASGRFLWTYRVNAPGAKAVRVHFSRFNVPAGAELAVTGREGDWVEVYGPERAGEFWSASVPGSVVYLEYRSRVGDAAAPPIEIDQISHIYRDPLLAGEPAGNQGVAQPQSPPPDCDVDVNCYSVPTEVRDAVGRLIFTTLAGTLRCTGTLLEDADTNTYAGYLLTANHCFNTPAAAASLEVYWFYQTDACNGVVPDLGTVPRSDGSVLLATSTNSDFTLVRLADDPRAGQGFVQWTTNAPVGQVVSIHHPSGEHKRVSVGVLTNADPICSSYPTNRYWYLDWVTGITASGSSGGPLFDANWRVVGQLFGTCSFSTPNCTNQQDYNVIYGKFDATYPSVASFLESVTPDDAYEDNDTPLQAPTIGSGTYGLRLVDLEDYFTVQLTGAAQITVTATFNAAQLDLDLELLTAGGTVLDSSAGATGTETVSLMATSGVYRVRASKSHKWGGDYTLTVTADPDTTVLPPTITAHPANQTGFLGQTVAFSVTASGTAPLAYQWLFNDTNLLAQATNAALSVGPLLESHGGFYSCLISNVAGMTTSQVALLTVKIPPAILTQPTGVVVNLGQDATFVVEAGGTPPLFYQWHFNETNSIAGATNNSLTITNAQDASAGFYSVVVSNGMTVISSNALLVINHPPAPASPLLQRFYGKAIKVRNSVLVGSDPDSDPLVVSAVNAFSAQGVPVTAAEGWVFYTPPVGLTNADSFGYTVSDGRGGFGAGTVSIVLTDNLAASLNLTWSGTTNNAVRVIGSGIPGRTYTIEFTESLAMPAWQALGTVVTDPFGVFEYVDQPPNGAPARFYRATTQ